MSDPMNHESMPDDLFRNRIAAALRELDQPESDADLTATLDAIEPEPLDEPAIHRILGQVRVSITGPADQSVQPSSSRQPPPSLAVDNQPRPLPRAISSPNAGSNILIVVACLALTLVLGTMAFQFQSPRHEPFVARNHSVRPDPSQTANADTSSFIDRVKTGDTLTTGPRQKRRVTLADGSILSINEQSRVTILGERRIKVSSGEVFVEVASMRSSGPTDSPTISDRFVVETAQRSVTALGTKFVVKAEGKSTNVVVTQGKVRVSGVNEVIPAGYELVADLNDSNPIELRPAKRSAYIVDWVKDLMAAAGSTLVPTSEHAGGTITVVDPQGQQMKLSLRKFHVDVYIEDGFARTTIDQTYFNHTWQQLEGMFRFPLPADASLSRLAMYVNGTLMEGGMVERDYGRNVFEQIRHTRRDPALLEWVDGTTFQMRVFPLEPRQEKRILLSYTQRLPADYGQSVYRFPVGHNLDGVREWSTHLRVKEGGGTKWYSPSHLLSARDDQKDLVIEGREDDAELDRDLVIEFGDRASPAPPSAEPNWSSCEQDGYHYVMLRYRPELKAESVRPPRHWVFLVENSADRNKILTATGRQIVKTLLENVEHTDSFSMIRAGTRAELFQPKPAACSIDNVAAAQRFLQEVEPLGALDLEQALQTVKTQCSSPRETWIVHLGTGIPVLGERDETTLHRLLPVQVRYVGVAVGKRWSKSFMQTAATRSGGHVTQINPDEAIAWRAFDLLSTLNAPRLTEIEVHVADDAAKTDKRPVQFLMLTNSLAHGQELAAVARLPVGQSLSKSVTIIGKLDGKPHSIELAGPLSSITPRTSRNGETNDPTEVDPNRKSISTARNSQGQTKDVQFNGEAEASRPLDRRAISDAGRSLHLPRTWARLEIDRLVSLGAVEHKSQIVELSKSMYVMSPFTSLLVLETEAMYAQFKVDRGRKDHWAMYPAPAEIPVVTYQGPANASPLDEAKHRLQVAQGRVKAAQINHERSLADKRPATDSQRFLRLQRLEQAEAQKIEREIQRIELAYAAAVQAAADPVGLAWNSVIFRQLNGQFVHSSRPSKWADQSRNLVEYGSNVKNFNLHDLQITGNAGREITLRNATGTSTVISNINQQAGIDHPNPGWIGLNAGGGILVGSGAQGRNNLMLSNITMNSSPQANVEFDFDNDGDGIPNSRLWNLDYPSARYASFAVSSSSTLQSDLLYLSISPHEQTPLRRQPNAAFWKPEDVPWPTIRQTPVSASIINGNGRDGYHYVVGTRRRYTPGNESDLPRARFWSPGLLETTSIVGPIDLDSDGKSDREEFKRLLALSYATLDNEVDDEGVRVRPDRRLLHFIGVEHSVATTLKDLPGYAPGLQSWQADRLAVVEQATTKPKNGEVDPEARRLIERARSFGWEKISRAITDKRLKAGRAEEAVIADGKGRFLLQREVGEGLKETVVHDGTHLWHLYPEIGLGAKRSFSRFHQSLIQSLIPWYVPPADDLSVGADIKTIAKQTIRIENVRRARDGANASPSHQKKPTPEHHQIALDLVFAEDGPLRESRVVDLTANKVLARQTIEATGLVRVYEGSDTLVAEAKYERSPAEAPDLIPATNDLVVLPLPYRSLASVPATVPYNLQNTARDYSKLSDEDAETLLATFFAEERELARLIEQRFTNRGDHRIGLIVLQASVNPQSPLVLNATAQHPNDPLASYLQQFASIGALRDLSGRFTIPDTASPFLKRVCGAYNHFASWASLRTTPPVHLPANIEPELAATLQFVRECRSLDLAANLLSNVQETLKRMEKINATTARMLNQTTSAIADEHGIPSFGRISRIEWLMTVGDDQSVAQAKELLRFHLAESLAVRGIPDLDRDVFAAFVKHQGTNGQPCREWGELVNQTASKMLEQKRHFSLIAVARRCVALGENQLAAEIFTMGTRDIDLGSNPPLNLFALSYASEASNWELAEECVQRALANEQLKHASWLWRDASEISHHRNRFKEWIERLDRACELEFAELPQTVDLNSFRRAYEQLFAQLEIRTGQLLTASNSEKQEFARLVQREASRWREIDVDDTAACHRAAKILTELGLANIAWDYWTTPLAESPDQSTAWQSFAMAMELQKWFTVADKAWSTAFACEPTNPEILLKHARFLWSTNQPQRSDELLTRITTGNWQPRFENVKSEAQTLLQNRPAQK